MKFDLLIQGGKLVIPKQGIGRSALAPEPEKGTGNDNSQAN